LTGLPCRQGDLTGDVIAPPGQSHTAELRNDHSHASLVDGRHQLFPGERRLVTARPQHLVFCLLHRQLSPMRPPAQAVALSSSRTSTPAERSTRSCTTPSSCSNTLRLITAGKGSSQIPRHAGQFTFSSPCSACGGIWHGGDFCRCTTPTAPSTAHVLTPNRASSYARLSAVSPVI